MAVSGDEPVIVGIDPGRSGAAVALSLVGSDPVSVLNFCRSKWGALSLWLDELNSLYDIVGIFIENVHAFPTDGRSSAFKFGTSMGGVFEASHRVADDDRIHLVSPVTWQNAFDCRTHGDKNVSKRKAIELFGESFPVRMSSQTHKVTHDRADAMLIALYGVEHWSSPGESGVG